MLSFRNFFGGLGPQMMVIKLKIKEMHFKNAHVNHWAHTLYKKILNTFTLLVDCTSLLQQYYWHNNTSCCLHFFF